jgi:hypothetical protein
MIGLVALTLMTITGCSRQIDIPADEGTAQTDQAPFREGASGESSSPVSDGQSHGRRTLPFDDTQTIPIGTLLTVRLRAPIFAEKSDSFEGIVELPVVVRGRTVIAQGALVSGLVEFATSSSINPERGYVRLVLTAIRVSGSDLPVRSASLFTRQDNPSQPSNPGVRLEKGHRLTFRLTEPLEIVTQTAQATR